MKHLFFIAILVLIFSCKNNSNPNKEFALAKVNGKNLYPSDILGDNYSEEDLDLINEEQILSWISRELWYQEASKKVEKTKNIDNNVEDYKQNLYIKAYQEQLVKNSSVMISDEMIIAYYKDHKEDFILEQNVYKAQILDLKGDLTIVSNIIGELNQDIQGQYVLDYCSINPERCLLNASWVEEDVLETFSLPEYLRNKSVKFQQYFKSDNKVCLYRILDERKKGDFVPLEQISKEIKDILIFQKTKSFLKNKEDDLFINAQNKNDFEIY